MTDRFILLAKVLDRCGADPSIADVMAIAAPTVDPIRPFETDDDESWPAEWAQEERDDTIALLGCLAALALAALLVVVLLIRRSR